MMRRFLLCFAAVLALSLPVRAGDDEVVDRILSRIEGKRVSFDYSYTLRSGGVPVQGSGHAVLEGRSYRAEGGGLVIRCDGATRWTVDPKAKEVYIESAGDDKDWFDKPAEFLRSVENLSYDGDNLSGVIARPGDSTRLSCSLSSIRTREPLGNADEFRFNPATLGSDWIITDLR